jgi:hypothetical protein
LFSCSSGKIDIGGREEVSEFAIRKIPDATRIIHKQQIKIVNPTIMIRKIFFDSKNTPTVRIL